MPVVAKLNKSGRTRFCVFFNIIKIFVCMFFSLKSTFHSLRHNNARLTTKELSCIKGSKTWLIWRQPTIVFNPLWECVRPNSFVKHANCLPRVREYCIFQYKQRESDRRILKFAVVWRKAYLPYRYLLTLPPLVYFQWIVYTPNSKEFQFAMKQVCYKTIWLLHTSLVVEIIHDVSKFQPGTVEGGTLDHFYAYNT